MDPEIVGVFMYLIEGISLRYWQWENPYCRRLYVWTNVWHANWNMPRLPLKYRPSIDYCRYILSHTWNLWW